jgi:hypothetical protein
MHFFRSRFKEWTIANAIGTVTTMGLLSLLVVWLHKRGYLCPALASAATVATDENEEASAIGARKTIHFPNYIIR